MNRKNVEPLTSHVPHFFSVSQISQLLMQNGWMDEYNEASNCPALEIKLVPTCICMYCSVGPEKQKLSS